MSSMRKGYYVLSKSKTGKKPRTGIWFKGTYQRLANLKNKRAFVLTAVHLVKGEYKEDTKIFSSVVDAKRVGWVKVA